ncbi:MAG: site-specific DNA-methyltransferase [Nanoarchaeota archaeon]
MSKLDEKEHFKSKDGEATIYRKDCIEFLKELPEEKIDIIVTDPAYSGMNQKMQFGKGRIVGDYKNGTGEKWFKEFHDTEENYRVFLSECKRVMKKDSHIYIMFDSFSLLSLAHLVREYFDVKNIIVWDKVNLGMGHNFRRRHEFVLFATKGYKKLNSKALPDVWRFKRVLRGAYPTQKPVEVFEAMLIGSMNTDKETVVCDPFLGSGSSAIAALKKKCIFIGADIDEKACKISKERIEHYLREKEDKYQKLPSHITAEKIFWR